MHMILLILVLLIPPAFASAADYGKAAGTAGGGDGEQIALQGARDNPCPPADLYYNHDGTFHCGYCWQYGGIVPPYYGAFAEQFEAIGQVCGIQLILTSIGYPSGPLDAYVWADENNRPGPVVGLVTGIDPGPVEIWPDHSIHDLAIDPVDVQGRFFAGYWANWSNAPCGYFIGEDLDGFGGGQPLTNIAPGIGYPSGWQNVSMVWGPTQALGIGAWVSSGGTPVREDTWGAIKSRYR